ncbi:MAG: hypothetical protein L0Y54_23230 [Sporichthyaceae bacterium]|nr:hypothetical protein [Sporichthyaceae bacterium]
MIDWLVGKTADVETLILVIIGLLVVIRIMMTYYSTRGAIVPLVVTLVVGGLVLWGINNIDWFQTKTDEEIQAAPTRVAARIDLSSLTAAWPPGQPSA